MRFDNEIRRTVAAIVVILAFVAVPLMGGNASATDAVGTASERVFRVGIADMPISTLNPNVYTTQSEAMAIFPCYSTLLQYDMDSALTGDMARDWTIGEDGLEWDFDLVDRAYFCDPANPLDKSHPVTAEDVIFTYTSIQSETSGRFYPALPGVIETMTSDGPFQLTIRLNGPYPMFLDALVSIPILPKYIWETEDLTLFDNMPLIGSGAFYYATDGLPDAGYAILHQNPIWHMIEERGWELRVGTYALVRYDDIGTAWASLKMGDIDAVINLAPSIFVNELPAYADIIGFHQSAGFVYEFNLNQMTDELRDELGGAFTAGTNNQLLLDDTVKSAIAMCVDKAELVDDVLYGLGDPADSLVPKASPWHYDYPDPVQFDPSAARDLLMADGWQYDLMGGPADSSTTPLCKAGGTDPLSFRFYTLDTSVTWLLAAQSISEWCGSAGIDLNLEIRSINEMNSAWYTANYDIWLWDWMFDPLADPLTMLEVLTTDAIGTTSDVFCSDPAYDALYQEALETMDPVLRAEIVDDMQAMAYEDMACQCIAYRDNLYAFNTDNWVDFGDLNSKYMMLPDVSNLWLSMTMSPSDNLAPQIGAVHVSPNTVSGYAEVGVPVTFAALGVVDDYQNPEALNYTWIWDYGGERQVDASPTVEQVFTEGGTYTVTLVVKETAPAGMYADYLSSYETCEITVFDVDNSAPYDLEISVVPAVPDSGDVIVFSGSAEDDEGDELYYSWDFGDGGVASGQCVEHQYALDGSYDVTMSVTDDIVGIPGSRPVILTITVEVGLNQPPMISVPDFDSVGAKVETTFEVFADDPDGDTLMFVWDWGDGTSSITYEPIATHAYRHGGTYVLTVTVSDQTGIDGHEVSDYGEVYVISGHAWHGGVK